MPELPEVEVVKLFLEATLLHQKITKLEILNAKSFIGNPELVEGQKIVKFSRLGKQLSIFLDNNLVLLVHLKMTGQLIFDDFMLGHPTKFSQYPNKSTRIIIHFSPLSSKRGTKEVILYFNDQRKFGWVRLLTKTELVEVQKNLGLDIFDPQFSSQYLYSQLQKSHRPIKVVLLDQSRFAGIGNIYANDALFLAGIHPSLPSKKISHSQVLKLHCFLLSIMRQSISAGGSTAKDKKYLHPDGTKGTNQFSFRVYQRTGEPCLQCGTPVKYFKLAGRGTFYCPGCQKL